VERVVITVRRNVQPGQSTQDRRSQLGLGDGLLMQERGREIDVVGQVIGALEERIGALRRRHDQIDGRVVVLVGVAEAVVVAGTGGAGARAGRALVQRQRSAARAAKRCVLVWNVNSVARGEGGPTDGCKRNTTGS